ncbi:MAG: hypothetical protein ACJ73S_14630 [Mycobacteriales bacterium]
MGLLRRTLLVALGAALLVGMGALAALPFAGACGPFAAPPGADTRSVAVVNSEPRITSGSPDLPTTQPVPGLPGGDTVRRRCQAALDDTTIFGPDRPAVLAAARDRDGWAAVLGTPYGWELCYLDPGLGGTRMSLDAGWFGPWPGTPARNAALTVDDLNTVPAGAPCGGTAQRDQARRTRDRISVVGRVDAARVARVVISGGGRSVTPALANGVFVYLGTGLGRVAPQRLTVTAYDGSGAVVATHRNLAKTTA